MLRRDETRFKVINIIQRRDGNRCGRCPISCRYNDVSRTHRGIPRRFPSHKTHARTHSHTHGLQFSNHKHGSRKNPRLAQYNVMLTVIHIPPSQAQVRAFTSHAHRRFHATLACIACTFLSIAVRVQAAFARTRARVSLSQSNHSVCVHKS